MKPFTDIQSYNKNMSKDIVMNDKLFFLEEADKSVFENAALIVDFGCADGTLVTELVKRLDSVEDIMPNLETKIIGYDTSAVMVSLAREKFSEIVDLDVEFTSHWGDVYNALEEARKRGGNKILILSSVLHELVSYESGPALEIDFQKIFKSGFDYIFVRDMMIPDYYSKIRPALPTEIDFNTLQELPDSKLTLENYFRVQSKKYEPYLNQFEEKWGKISDSVANLLHFALKYRWTINWDRELNENYIGLSIEEFIRRASFAGYDIQYLKKFNPIKRNFRRIFLYDLEWDTHVKMILKASKFNPLED